MSDRSVHALILLILALSCALPATAQSVDYDFQEFPNLHGQWAGPWDLASAMGKVPGGADLHFPVLIEIAHAIVLPPDSPVSAADSKYGGKILFINDRITPYGHSPVTWESKDQPTFVWDVTDPTALETVMVGNAPKTDLFCAGHAFLGDGTLLTVGGLDREKQWMYGGGAVGPRTELSAPHRPGWRPQ